MIEMGSFTVGTLILMTLSCIINDVRGFPSGIFSPYVKDYACEDMWPQGHSATKQTGGSHYVLLNVPGDYTPGEEFNVTLKSTQEGSDFLGFMLQARKVGGNERVGEFTTIPSEAQHNCQDGAKTAAVSHNDKEPKSNLQFTWKAPDTGVGDINFVFTIVETKEVYWQKLLSNSVAEHTETAAPTGSTTTTADAGGSTTATTTISTTTSSPSTGTPLPDVDPSLCGRECSCYRLPADCTSNCDILLSWKLKDTDKVAFKLEGTVPTANYYIAIGLSNDDKMGDDSVMECIHSTTTAETGVQMSYNIGRSNAVLSDKTLGLVAADSKVYYNNGKLVCHITRYIVVPTTSPAAQTGTQPVMAAQTSSQVFNLNQNYTLLVAKGAFSSGFKNQHFAIPSVSPQPINLASPELINVGGTTVGFMLVKIHGILMIIAWMISASIAIMMPRYHKKSFNDKQCCGKDLWFQIHQPLMIITALLTIAAFIIIFISVQGYAEYSTSPENIHPPLGIVTTFLVILNPLMAACRCAPHSSKRPIFNVLHLLVGEAAHICAVATIFISTYMSKSGAPEWAKWVLVAFICWHVLIEIILSIHKCCTNKKSSEEKYEMSSRNDVSVRESRRYQNRSGSKFKPFMIVLHALGVIACALALIIPIAQT